MTSDTNPIVLITGGADFLGQALVRELLGPETPVTPEEIRIFDIRPVFDIVGPRIRHVTGDVRDYEALRQVVRGAQIVFHLAAIVDWGTHPRKEVLSVNIGGTENVIRACVEEGVGILMYTSSENAIYTGKPIRDGSEDLPYPDRYPNAYCESKAVAERQVLSVSGDELRTVALRPAGIYGEGDPYHMPALIEMARKGLYARIGDGNARCQHVYVGNVAWAHVVAAHALRDGESPARGQVYS